MEDTIEIPQNPVEIPELATNVRARRIGLAIAIIAVLLAINSAFGNAADDEQIVSQVRASNTWAYFQAKRIRSTQTELTRDLLLALGKTPDSDLLQRMDGNVSRYQKESDEISLEAKGHEARAASAEAKGNYHDAADIFLQIAMVLCSVALLVGQGFFFIGGMTFAALGVGLGTYAALFQF